MLKFSLSQMRQRCLASIESFTHEGVDLIDGPPYLFFKDNGSKILGVAHLDSVQGTTHFQTVIAKRGRTVLEHLVFNGQLDDRLGAYLLLDYLPQLGLEFDVLLTEDEESCSSTALFFQPPRQYNWMFSFDREGNDVVLYDYDNGVFKKALRAAGFRIDRGTYSDICELEYLGCCGVNISTGLRNGHGTLAYTDLRVLRQQVGRFVRFYEDNKDKHFEHIDSAPRFRWSSHQDWAYRGAGGYETCTICKQQLPWYEIIEGVCDECEEYYEDAWAMGKTARQPGEKSHRLECQACGILYPPSWLEAVGGYGLLCVNCREDLQGLEMV